MRKLTVTNVLLGLLTMAIIAQPLVATATHQPADKVVARGGTVEEVGTSDTAIPGEPITEETVLLSTEFKTSSPTDLMIHVTLECSIITDVTTQGGPPPTEGGPRMSTGEAEGRIRVWAEFDGKVVPINSTSENPQPHDDDNIGTDIDKVTFCNRAHKQDLTDAEDPQDGTDTLRTYLRTKSANAFNWIRLNTGNGIHNLTIKADFVPGTITPGSAASGFVGNRMVIVEPTKMSNHAAV